jgi:hypothetical protein
MRIGLLSCPAMPKRSTSRLEKALGEHGQPVPALGQLAQQFAFEHAVLDCAGQVLQRLQDRATEGVQRHAGHGHGDHQRHRRDAPHEVRQLSRDSDVGAKQRDLESGLAERRVQQHRVVGVGLARGPFARELTTPDPCVAVRVEEPHAVGAAEQHCGDLLVRDAGLARGRRRAHSPGQRIQLAADEVRREAVIRRHEDHALGRENAHEHGGGQGPLELATALLHPG